MKLSDKEFIEAFESLTLPPERFNHLGHLRLGWLYLKNYPLEIAIEKTISGISAYASSLGATDKFQYTLSEAIIRIMAARMELEEFDSFESYLECNDDLLDNLLAVVGAYYSVELLYSSRARQEFVRPDLKPFS